MVVKHSVHTRGGVAGHLFRRMIHITMCFYPWLYYQGAERWLPVSIHPPALLWCLLALNIIIEIIRLSAGLTLPGHRAYERTQICSLAWGLTGICLVFLFSPGGYPQGVQYAAPIVWCLALCDPLMGEMRARSVSMLVSSLAGGVLALCLWGLACAWYGTPWPLMLFMPIVTVLAERPLLSWIDDNGTLTLIPLLVILLCHWLGFL